MDRHASLIYVLIPKSPLRSFVCAVLLSAALNPVALDSAHEYLTQPTTDRPTCLVLGTELPDMSCLTLQRRMPAGSAGLVFVSECVDVALSVSAIKNGAVDFMATPLNPVHLIIAVRAALEVNRRERMNRARLEELHGRYGELTRREREALPLITAGLLNKQAASIMGISPITLQIHRGRIMRKLAAQSFADLVRIADALGKPPEALG